MEDIGFQIETAGELFAVLAVLALMMVGVFVGKAWLTKFLGDHKG